MAKVEVFDPAMCCPTGVCGPAVDPALVRFAADLDWLVSQKVEVARHGLSQDPGAFVRNTVVAAAIRERDDALPLVLVDGKVVAQGSYPDRVALARAVGVEATATTDPAPSAQPCCAPSDAPVTLGKGSGASKKCCC